MLMPPIPANEDQRLEDLRRVDISLTSSEETFDVITRDLARIFDVPGAMISFTDRDTQYFKSAVGLPPPYSETRCEPRELSVCSHVIGNNAMLVVEDLLADDRFRDNPIVLESGVRFYAGAPLHGESGTAVGSLCIVDIKPRTISDREREMLRLLAWGIMAQVKLQIALRTLLRRSVQIDRDLEQAMRMQRFLLPPARIEGDGWRIEHLYRPAERLGGDFIDVHRRPDGRIMMLVADVSGHGTSASLSTAMTKTVFLHAAPRVSSPAALLGAIHRELIDMTPPGQFITALAALFDPATKQIELASAGHPRPLRIGDGSVEVIDTQNDLILLAVPETVYERVHRVTLRPGERLLIYTDGATEAADDQGRMLETRGLSRLVGEAGQGNGDAFLATLFDRINDHAGHRLFDDVALLSIRVE